MTEPVQGHKRAATLTQMPEEELLTAKKSKSSDGPGELMREILQGWTQSLETLTDGELLEAELERMMTFRKELNDVVDGTYKAYKSKRPQVRGASHSRVRSVHLSI